MSSRSSSRSSKPASIAKSSSSSGSSLSLTSLTVTSKRRLAARPAPRRRSRPGSVSCDGARLARLGAEQRPPRSPGSGCRRRARRAGRGPRRRRTAPTGRPALPRPRPPLRASRRSRSRRSRPAAAGRSAVSSRARRSRIASISARSAPRPTCGSRRGTSRPWYSPSSAVGQHADLDRELERLPCAGSSPRSSLGSPTGTMPGGLDRLGVPARERVANGFLEHHLAADALDHQRRGHLAAAEAGELQLAAELRGLALEPALDLAGGHLHLRGARASPRAR